MSWLKKKVSLQDMRSGKYPSKFYAIAFMEHPSMYGIYYLIPLNLVVRFFAKAKYKLLIWLYGPTEIEQIMLKTYEAGVHAGKEQLTRSEITQLHVNEIMKRFSEVQEMDDEDTSKERMLQ